MENGAMAMPVRRKLDITSTEPKAGHYAGPSVNLRKAHVAT